MPIKVRQAVKKQCKAKIAIAVDPAAVKPIRQLEWRSPRLGASTDLCLKAKFSWLTPRLAAPRSTPRFRSSSARKAARHGDVYEPETYAMDDAKDVISYAEDNGYEWLIFDSFSHYWMGDGGALEKVGGNFSNWKTVTPAWNRMIDKILRAKIHIIADMRLKVQYELIENERGKKEPKRLGLEPIMRNDIEYVFDIYGTIDLSNTLHIMKTRASDHIKLESDWNQPGEKFAEAVLKFCEDGVEDRYIMPADTKDKFDELAQAVGEEQFSCIAEGPRIRQCVGDPKPGRRTHRVSKHPRLRQQESGLIKVSTRVRGYGKYPHNICSIACKLHDILGFQ
jgi:hypothetical protein